MRGSVFSWISPVMRDAGATDLCEVKGTEKLEKNSPIPFLVCLWDCKAPDMEKGPRGRNRKCPKLNFMS